MSRDAVPVTLLIVDDDEVDRMHCRRLLTRDGEQSFRILEASSAEAGLAVCRAHRPACVLLDLQLPDADGLSLLTRFPAPRPAVLLLTGREDPELAERAQRAGAAGCLNKNEVSAESLIQAIRTALAESRPTDSR